MAIDFDPFHDLDMDFDHEINTHDLEMHEFAEHGSLSIGDLNHDHIADEFQNDLNHDNLIDQFQVDLDHNNIIDQFEMPMPGATQFNSDIMHDGQVDYMDVALAKSLLIK